MSKYKVGDKVVVKIISADQDEIKTYSVSGVNDDWRWCLPQNLLERYTEPLSTYTEPLEAKIRRQAAEITRLLAENKELKEDFEKSKRVNLNMGRLAGQNEAWELALKLRYMDYEDKVVCFGLGYDEKEKWVEIMEKYTYSEAAAKVAEWEKAKEEIKVGDVVKIHEGNDNDLCVLCMSTDKKYYNAVDGYGAVYYMLTKEMITKTGRHMDINGFLKQIRGEQE